MADVLDSEVQAMAGITTSVATLLVDVQALVADFQSTSSGQIAANDPRWATLTDAISQAAASVGDLDAKVKAALPATNP